MHDLRVMTLNLCNSDIFRFERAHLVAEEIARLKPHLVALQELSITHDMSAWLVNRVNEWSFGEEYSVYPWNKIGPQGAFEGLAILTCLAPLAPSEAIDLRGGGRIAQRIIVEFLGARIAFCNLHFHHPPGFSALRLAQSRMVSDWMKNLGDCIPLVTGDFNDTPGSETMTFLLERWTSAYAEYNSKEPDRTFPTPLASSEDGWCRPRVVDFVLFDSLSLATVDVKLCCTQPGGPNEDLYPSDHYGLIADFTLR